MNITEISSQYRRQKSSVVGLKLISIREHKENYVAIQQSLHPTGGIRSAKKEFILCLKEFRQNSFILSHPPAGNANRWKHNVKTFSPSKTTLKS